MLKNKTALSLSPLALLTLAACGGTSSGGSTSSKGAVQNGPLEGAFAFLDLHIASTFQGDGVYDDATEQGMATQGASGALGVAGGYSLTEPASGSYTLTATTTAATVDIDTGTAYGAGITLKARGFKCYHTADYFGRIYSCRHWCSGNRRRDHSCVNKSCDSHGYYFTCR